MAKAKMVLVVDDHWEIRELLQTLLENEGYIVKLASNGQEAMRQLEPKVPDVVLLDLMMPVMDGWQFLDAVSKMPGYQKLPVILLSASRQLPQTGRGSPQNVRGWLAKPFEVDELLRLIAGA